MSLLSLLKCAVICFLAAPWVAAEEKDSVVQIFPGRKIFPMFTADGLAHQLSLSRVTENRDWIGAVGGLIPLAQINAGEVPMQVSIAATIFNRLIVSPGITVYTVDYKVDFPFDVRFSDLALRFAVGHISCHFADDALELLGKRSIQYINDYLTVSAAYDMPVIGGYVYGLAGYIHHTVPVRKRPGLLQAGADFGNYPIAEYALLYGAVDVRIKEDVGWGSTQSYQIGLKLFTRAHYRLRLAYTLRLGFEDRGQFFLNKETKNMYSVFVDF
jgi:hypothetical protein